MEEQEAAAEGMAEAGMEAAGVAGAVGMEAGKEAAAEGRRPGQRCQMSFLGFRMWLGTRCQRCWASQTQGEEPGHLH